MTPIIFFLAAFTILDIYFIYYAMTRRDREKATPVLGLSIAIFCYTYGYLLEITADTLDGALTALNFEELGIALISPFFLLTVATVFNRKFLRRWMLPSIFIFGFVLCVTVLTNDYHHLYYESITYILSGGFFLLKLNGGSFHVVLQAVLTLSGIIALVLVLERFRRGSRKLRSQLVYIAICLLVPLAMVIITALHKPDIYYFDYMPFAFNFAVIIFIFMLSRHRLLDITTASNDAAISTMIDAFIILERDLSFVSCNDAAKRLFPSLAEMEPMEEVTRSKDWPVELLYHWRDGESVDFRKTNTETKTVEYCRAVITQIFDQRSNSHLGWSVLILDITESTVLRNEFARLIKESEPKDLDESEADAATQHIDIYEN